MLRQRGGATVHAEDCEEQPKVGKERAAAARPWRAGLELELGGGEGGLVLAWRSGHLRNGKDDVRDKVGTGHSEGAGRESAMIWAALKG
jgi:hypothetical protein